MASPVCRPSSTITSSGLTDIDPSAAANYQLQQRWRLEEHVKALQDERRKIEAFKRELPICMQLLTHAIKSSNEQLLAYGESAQFSQKNEISGNDNEESDEGTSEKLVLDELIPWQRKASDNPVKEQDAEENGAVMYVNEKLKVVDLSKPGSSESGNKDSGQQEAFAVNSTQESLLPEGRTYSSTPGLFMHSKQKIGGGAFVPFSRDKKAVLQSSKSGATMPELAITSDHEANSLTRDTDSKKYNFGGGRLILESEKKKTDALMNPGVTVLRGGASNTGHAVGQSQKKMRRCWSTDLHRCFVDALQELGGPQVATPKQIRELMNVDGLTNDEVKSHLQKYRLHARVPSLAVRPAASRSSQIVVLGGLWLPPDYPAVASQQGSTYCNSTQRRDLCAPSIAQDFYCQVNSSMRYDQPQNVPAQREISSSQVHIQLPGQLSGGAPISSEASKEDSFEVDENSEISNRKLEEHEECV